MDDDFRFSPLENGLDFLLSSLEHLSFASSMTPAPGDLTQLRVQKRHLKYALLHLCSGIEVVFKVRLRQEHWSLVFKNVNKADRDAQEEADFESVSFQEAQDRLVGICQVELSEEQRKALKNLRDRRNKLEHFGAVDSLLAVTANVSTMVSFLLDFIESAFDAGSLHEEQALHSEIRSALGTCSAFVEQRWKEIQKEVDGFHSVIECPTCQQRALQVDGGKVKCRFCYHTSEPEDAANEYISRVLGSTYSARTCPNCGHDALVAKPPGVDGTHGYFCFSCGEDWGSGKLACCWDCNELYVAGEDDSGICDGCFRAKMEKD